MTSGPCLDGLSLALSQISFAVNELTKKNFKYNVSELKKLVQNYGPEAERHLFRSLLSYADFSSDKATNKDIPQVALLLQECQELITRPNFVLIICYAIDNPESQQRSIKYTPQLLFQLSKTLKLSKVQEVIFGIALQSSSNPNVRVYASNFVKQKLPDWIRPYIETELNTGQESAGFGDLAIEALHLLLTYILQVSKDEKIIREDQLKAFLDLLRRDFPRDRVPVILEPLLYSDQKEELLKLNLDTGTLSNIMADIELSNIMEEIGYSCCASLDECKETLEHFGVANINSQCVAKVLGMMARTMSSLEGGGTFQASTMAGPRRDDQIPLIQSWNIEVFVDVLKELCPALSWRQVIHDLDYPEFGVRNPEGVRMIVFAYFKATNDLFPIEAIYRRWKNTLGQLSWIEHSLSDPDVFCFADFPYHSVVIDILKSPPDDTLREVATWKSLELVEALLYLSESGHYEAALKLFSYPVKNCPDVLVLALLQVNSTWHTLRNDLVSMLMPLFLGNHPNSMSVLHYAWHGQGQSPSVRQLVMQSMADWYMKADAKGDQVEQQTRLSRILDVAQDLKALSMLLSSTPFAFVIDLAALASRREYLKLDKWLNDKKQEHQDSFVIALVNFLKKRCPHLVGMQADKDMPRAVQLPQETISTMLSFLQLHLSTFTLDVVDTVRTMLNIHGPIVKNRATVGLPNPPLGMPMKRNSGFDGGPSTPPIGNQGDPFISFSSSFGSSAPGSQLGGFGSHSLSNNSAVGSSSFGSLSSNSNFGPSTVDSLQSMAISSIGGQNFGGSSFGQSHTGPFGGNHSLNNPPLGSQSLGSQSLGQSLGQLGQSLGNQPIGQSLSTAGLPNIGSQSLGGPSLTGGNLGPSLSGPHGLPSLGSSIGGSNALGSSVGQSILGVTSIGGPSLGVGGPIGAPPGNKRNPLLSTSGIGTGVGSFSSYQQQQQQQHQQSSAFNQSRQHADRLKQVAATGDLSAVFPGMDQTFSKETEDEVNSYFQRLFNQSPNSTMSIEEVLEMLKRFKDSPIRKERDIFQCMLRNLFEEYKFFPQYPEKELHIIACLFGGIIEQGLVTYMALGIALRYVLEALRKPLGSKMYMFGTTALERFKTRLKDYPHYCQHLASIPHFKDFPHQLVDYINYGQKSVEPPMQTRATQNNSPGLFGRSTVSSPGRLLGFPGTNATSSQSSSPVLTSGGQTKASTMVTSAVSTVVSVPTSSVTSTSQRKEPSIANTTNIDTLLGATEPAEIQAPPDTVQDKIHFIFNNISGQTLQAKSEELKQLVLADFYPWLAQYFVMKRVSIEPNFHQLYTDFLKALAMNELSKAVLTETFRNIKVLLRSDKGPANFSDRSLLKNLGHWLGMQTVANNKPILFKDLELKSLLMEAFFKGQQELLYVVPFVAKVLESCSKSKVFKPPNPWLMGVMGVLAELHQLQDLKLNLKFEIEVLCNTLGLELKEIKPTDFVKDPEILDKLEYQLTANEKEKAALPGAGMQQQQPVPPLPMFAYHEISISSLNGLAPHIQINQNIPVFQRYPHLKQCIRPAVERAVQELLVLVVEKAIKICLTTAEMIVKKDFALDPEESRMRVAAHHMVRNITAGMSMITCRDLLQTALNTHIKSNLLATLRGADQQQKEQLEQVATIVANDNLELACAFIQKTATEKALLDIDKRLAAEYELRKHARSENRRYCDPHVLTYQAERMPEQIRLKVGGVTSSQMTVYEEFARSIPGFLPPEAVGAISEPFPKPMAEPMSNILPSAEPHSFMPDDVVHILGRCAADIEPHIHHMDQQLRLLQPSATPHLTQLHNLLDMVVNARVTRDNVSSLKLIRKAVEGVLTTIFPNEQEMALRYKDCHLIILRGFQDQRGYGPLWTARQVLKALADLPADIRFNLEGIDILIRAHLINVREFDLLLSQLMETGHNQHQAIHFAVQFCRLYLMDDKPRTLVSEFDLSNTLETLSRISQNRQNPEGLSSLLESVHHQSAPQGFIGSGRENHYSGELDKAPGGSTSIPHTLLAHDFEDPPGLNEKVEYLLREWVRLYHHASAGRYSEKAFQAFVPQLHQYGILKTDDLITRFFRLCTEMCVDLTYRALNEYAQNPNMARTKCFPTIDAYCRLIALLVKHSGDAANSITKINLLNRVLGIVEAVLMQDHEIKQGEFHQLAYHRIIVMLLLELNAPETVLEAINFQILSCFTTALHNLNPLRAPGFAYAWLELVAHRTLCSKLLLNSPQQKGWVLYHQLLIELFKFLAPFLRNVELARQTHLLYKGTLRVLLVLLHDFPEFLCDYHFSFCDVIPPNCIQMRNLILSAFPRNMRLPDPFTPNLKVDLLTDIAHAPRILTNFAAAIQPASFKKDLDSYLKTRAPVTFLSELRSHLQVSLEPSTRGYNVPLMNALVLYVGTQAIAYIQSKSGTPSISTITHSSHMDIFQNLAVDLDTEGRYLFLNAIANQLRYPNSHTHYFSCTLLYLFAEANSEAIQEQITRVLLERLIVNRPHPWGLLITFIELIKIIITSFGTMTLYIVPQKLKSFLNPLPGVVCNKNIPQEEMGRRLKNNQDLPS